MEDRSDMAVFVSVMREGSFAAAAKALQMTPSGVSRRISKLEERLGVRLLNRTTRRLSLTEPGEIYFRRSAQIISDIEETEREATQLYAAPRGKLRVTASNAFGHQHLVRLVPEFLRAYPETSVELTLTDALVDLAAEGVDVAVRSGHLADSSIIARQLTSTRRILCAAPDYLERKGVPQTPDDLLRHNCLIRHDQNQIFNEWQFDTEDEKKTVRVTGSFSANNIEALYRAALHGVGILRVSAFVVEKSLRDGELVALLEDQKMGGDLPIYALYLSNRHLSPKIRAFIDFMRARLVDDVA